MTREIHLHYFHGRGIGEPIRLILAVGGIAFTDHRYEIKAFASMDALKAKLPFGQLPALEVDGQFFGQTDSLMRFAARLANLYPDDVIDAARSDMIVVHQADIHSAIAKMSFDGVPGAPGTKMVPEEQRQEKISTWFETSLPGLLDKLDKLAEDGFMVGGALSWADICVFNRLTQLQDIDNSLLDGRFAALRQVYERVGALPSVRKWIDLHLEDYPRGNVSQSS